MSVSPPPAAEALPVSRAAALPSLRQGSLELLRRLLIGGYVVAACTSVAGGAFADNHHVNVALLLLAAVDVAIAALLALGRRLPDAAIKFLGTSGPILLISVGVAFARPLGPTPLFYMWPALNCSYFGTRRDARIASALLCASFAVALVFSKDAQVPVIMYFAVVFIFLAVLVVLQHQVQRTNELMRELAHAATTDSLTGLLDRRAFSQAFAREVQRARSSGLDLSVVFLDLDHFKAVNDGFGHATGDEALCAFARILERTCSVTDVCARMGGEEFAVVLFDANADAARQIAEQIATALARWSAEHPPALTTSAGIAILGADAATPSQLLSAADHALYAAKAAGRNRVITSGQSVARVLVAA